MSHRSAPRSSTATGALRSALAVLAVTLVLFSGVASAEPSDTRYAGRPLAEVLETLQARGLPLVFSSRLVPDDMRVLSEPGSSDPREVVEELLAPHRLELRDTESGRWVVARRSRRADAGVGKARRASADALAGEPLTAGGERLDVTSDDPLHDRAGSLRLAARDLFVAGWRATDPAEVLRGLPGVVGRESSSEVGMRGGGSDEVMVVLDGQELVEPHHLRDFGSVLSVVAARVVGSVEVHRGDLPPSYGDRMSGVIELTSRSPADVWGGELEVGADRVQAGSSGAAFGDRARWLLSLRHGEPEVVSEIGESGEKPFYTDGFAKLSVASTAGQELRLHVLASEDGFDFTADLEQFYTDFSSRTVWLSHEAQVGRRLSTSSKVDVTEVARDRRGIELTNDLFAIDDRRRSTRIGLQWRGSFAGDRHLSSWGLEAHRDRASYRYSNRLPVPVDGEPPISGVPVPIQPDRTVEQFISTLRGDHYALFVAERRELRPWLVAEAGLRYDRSTLLTEAVVNPRLSLAAQLGRSVVRLAWGKTSQSQRAYELQVPDGEIELQPLERSEYATVQAERAFGAVAVVVDAYHRKVSNPRPRYVNLFKPVSRFPETEIDRVRLAPSSSEASGVELMVRGRVGDRTDWRVSYAASRARDVLEGQELPRPNDQPQTVRIDLGWKAPRGWLLRLAWLGHSGWPTTSVLAEEVVVDDRGSDVVGIPGVPDDVPSTGYQFVLGPLHHERLKPFHRLDLVASRSWQWRRYQVALDLVLENLYDRENARGFDTDPSIVTGAGASPRVELTPEAGRGFSPAFNLRLAF